MTKNPRRVILNSTRKKKGTSQMSAPQKKAQSVTLSTNPRFETILFYFMFFERRKREVQVDGASVPGTSNQLRFEALQLLL